MSYLTLRDLEEHKFLNTQEVARKAARRLLGVPATWKRGFEKAGDVSSWIETGTRLAKAEEAIHEGFVLLGYMNHGTYYLSGMALVCEMFYEPLAKQGYGDKEIRNVIGFIVQEIAFACAAARNHLRPTDEGDDSFLFSDQKRPW